MSSKGRKARKRAPKEPEPSGWRRYNLGWSSDFHFPEEVAEAKLHRERYPDD